MAGGRSNNKKGRRGKKRPRPKFTPTETTNQPPPRLEPSIDGVPKEKQQQQQQQQLHGESGSRMVETTDKSGVLIIGSSRTTNGEDSSKRTPTTMMTMMIRMYGMLCLFRILNTFLIQSYFDPDEFWQTLEPAYCHVFDNCEGLTWEWKTASFDGDEEATNHQLLNSSLWWSLSMLKNGPVRTYLSVWPTHMLYTISKALHLDSSFVVSRGPMILAAITVAAPIDLAVWYTARRYYYYNNYYSNNAMLLPAWCLFCSLTSWFNGYTIVRTFSNCQETLFLMLAVALVSPELLVRALPHDNTNGQYRSELLRSCLAFFLGGLSVAIRISSLAAFVPMGILLALRKPTVKARLQYFLVPCALFGLLGIVVAMVVDRIYFGFWTLPLLSNFYFNVVLNQADLYGSHPMHWYVTAGLPAVAGLLLPFVLLDLYKLKVRQEWQGKTSSAADGSSASSYGQRNLWIIVVSYMLTMSTNAHKEFRFLLPVLPLMCILAAPHVRAFFVGPGEKPNKKRMYCIGTVWVVANMAAVLYLGLFHQSGPIAVNREIVSIAELANTTDSFAIHYLTGACHSTPLHSHLHSPPLKFDTWHLDCSPECRADPDIICESEQFARDPVGFVTKSYCSQFKRLLWRSSNNSKDCVSPPDFVVTFSEYVPQIQSHLDNFGLHAVARFPHSINGLSFNVAEENNVYGRVTLLGGLGISVDEVVLFSKV